MSISLQSESHWKYEQKLTLNDLRIKRFFDSLRSVAKRQIKSLDRRMENAPYKSIYLEEIKKVLSEEQDRILRRQRRGEEID